MDRDLEPLSGWNRSTRDHGRLLSDRIGSDRIGSDRIGAEPIPPLPAFGKNWWLYTTGLLGLIFIWGNTSFVRVHGVLVLSLSVIAGNVTTAVLIDFLSEDGQGDTATVVGAVLTVVGVVTALADRRVPRGLSRGEK